MIVWLVTVLAIVAAVLILPPLLDALPRGKSRGGGLGPALSEFNAIFNPAERHVEAGRRQLPAERDNGEPKD